MSTDRPFSRGEDTQMAPRLWSCLCKAPSLSRPNLPLGTHLCSWSWTLGAGAGIGLLW